MQPRCVRRLASQRSRTTPAAPRTHAESHLRGTRSLRTPFQRRARCTRPRTQVWQRRSFRVGAALGAAAGMRGAARRVHDARASSAAPTRPSTRCTARPRCTHRHRPCDRVCARTLGARCAGAARFGGPRIASAGRAALRARGRLARHRRGTDPAPRAERSLAREAEEGRTCVRTDTDRVLARTGSRWPAWARAAAAAASGTPRWTAAGARYRARRRGASAAGRPPGCGRRVASAKRRRCVAVRSDCMLLTRAALAMLVHGRRCGSGWLSG
jgi:hypothetical protein